MPEQIDLAVIGTSGLKQYGGRIDEELYHKLKGRKGPATYREMADNSSTIGAIRYVIKALVRQVSWRVEPAVDGDPACVEQAEFLESCLVDMSQTWEDCISEILSFLDYGWHYQEIVYKLRKGDTDDATTRSQFDDGKVGWRKLATRSQDTLDHWEFDEDGGLRGMWQTQSSGRPKLIPIEKSLLFRTETTKDNPEGRSIYRNAVLDWFFLKRICEIESVGIERDMTGMIVMEVPSALLDRNAPPASRALLTELQDMLGQLKRDEREYAIVPAETDKSGSPSGFKLKLLSAGGSRQIDTTRVKEFYKLNILQSVVAQFLQLGMSGVGSFALASSQTDLFAVALGNYLQTICAVMNRFAIPRLMKMNGVPVEQYPYMVHGDIESPPLGEIAQFISALAGAGQLPESKSIKRRLLEIAGLPIPEDDELTNTPVEAPAAGMAKHSHDNGRRFRSKAPLRSMGSVLDGIRSANIKGD